MKTKIRFKALAILICLLAFPLGKSVSDFQNRQILREDIALVSTRNPNTEQTAPENTPPEPPIKNSPQKIEQPLFPWEALKLSAGLTFLLIIGTTVILILIAVCIFLFVKYKKGEKAHPQTVNIAMSAAVTLCLAGVILFLPRSQSSVFQGWNLSRELQRSNFIYDKFFGTAPNRYEENLPGQITSLYLNDKNLQSAEQLSGIENLTALEYLEIADSPIDGKFDVSPFTELKGLTLRNTKLSEIVGLDNLKKLDKIDLEGSPVETVNSFGTVWRINLSRTKIKDLSNLQHLSPLKELTLEGMDLSLVQGIEKVPHTNMISLRHSTQVRLERLKGSELLILDGSDVTDLTALSKWSKLTAISIFETDIESLKGLENTKTVLINSDNPNFTAEKAEQFLKRKVIVSQLNFNTFSFTSLFPPNIRLIANTVALLLFVAGVSLLLPIPRNWRNRSLMKIRRIGLFMIPGAFFVLGLWLLSNLEIPVGDGQQKHLDSAGVIYFCAVFVALLWLILTPLSRILLDTKTLGQSELSVPIFRISRLFVIIAVISPFLFLFFNSFWVNEDTAGFGVMLIVLMSGLYISYSIILGLLTYGVFFELKTVKFSKWLLLLTFIPLLPVILMWSFIFLRPNFLVQISGIAVISFASPAFVIPIIVSVAVKFYFATLVWRLKKANLINIVNGDYEKGAIIEIPFRQNPHQKPLSRIIDFATSTFSENKSGSFLEKHDLEIVNVQNVGQLTSVPITIYTLNSLEGVIVIIQSKDLFYSKNWEFHSLREWLREVYRLTWSPIWFVGDWIGELSPNDLPIQEKLEILDSINPYISGLENFSAPAGSVLKHAPPKNISECLGANQIIERELLFKIGLLDILGYAPTPIAMMVRSIFSQPNLANRLDTVVRTVEAAVSTISLVLLAEYQTSTEQTAKTEKTVSRFLEKSKLEFGDWTSLFNGLMKNKKLFAAGEISAGMGKSAISESQKLREMVETVGGEKAVKQVRSEVEKIEDSLALLVAVRNVITAHGAATQRVSPEFYRAVLIVALDFLNALQWQSFVLQAFFNDKQKVVFQGCIADESINNTEKNVGVFVEFSKDGEKIGDLIDVGKFFKTENAAQSLAIYAGANRFNEPISGMSLEI